MRKNKSVFSTLLAVTVALVASTQPSFAALSGDYAGFDTAISASVTAATAAISAVAVLKMSPGVLKWGYNKVIGWFK